MQLQQAIQQVFMQLTASLEQISNDQYAYRSRILSNASIGQHVRHIIEMFQCMEQGYVTGIINYEKRKRDEHIETDRAFAVELLKVTSRQLNKENKSMLLQGCYDEDSTDLISVDTNYYREIAYNLEHTIHHMALIKVGMLESAGLNLPDSFGVAPSTIKFRKECAQ